MRKQLDRDGHRVAPKTPQAIRDVVLMPALARLLREHRLASSHSRPADLVFASALGSGLDRRNVSRRGLERAVTHAGLDDAQRRSQPHFWVATRGCAPTAEPARGIRQRAS